jgi:ubiquinone/menaquinone biosynthesis C-methylase UbiE
MSALYVFHRCTLAAVLCFFCASGCSKKAPDAAAQTPQTVAALPAGQSATSGPSLTHGPDSHPAASSPAPINCPLRKAGVDPQHLKPFADVEKYVAFLERADRASWQKPDEIVRALHLTGDEVIADVGAGSGYFTFRFAAALPRGRVVAIDIEPEMIRHIHHKAMTEGIANVEPVLASGDDPQVPAAADIVFICDVLHHVSDRRAWLAHLHDEMKADGRLILVEFKEGDLPEGPPAAAKITRNELLTLMQDAGLVLSGEEKDLLPYQVFLVFRKQA